MYSKQQLRAAEALKSIARDQHMKSIFQQTPEMNAVLRKAAQRYVSGDKKEEAIHTAQKLQEKGYAISVEYIGENTETEEKCRGARDEFLTLMKTAAASAVKGATISLDLSHIGLSVDSELAMEHLSQLAEEAKLWGYSVMISMEESEKTDAILDIYTRTTEKYPHVGITLQAHLHRTEIDLQYLMKYPGKIRMVKGAFQEPSSIALSRSEALNERYLHCVGQLVEARHPVSIATHDQSVVDEIVQRGYGHLSHVEFEMLFGICPQILKRLREENFRTKVYLTYGEEWYLYFCHRLAEHPPNIYQAISDLAQPPYGIDDLY